MKGATSGMIIRAIREDDRDDWVRLRDALMGAAEDHARAAGFAEIASDADVANADSLAAHHALGYEEVERVVCFRRSLRASS
jgi:hypothetical protein